MSEAPATLESQLRALTDKVCDERNLDTGSYEHEWVDINDYLRAAAELGRAEGRREGADLARKLHAAALSRVAQLVRMGDDSTPADMLMREAVLQVALALKRDIDDIRALAQRGTGES